MRLSVALALAFALVAGCGGPSKKIDPYAPRPDDIPQALTCCVTTAADGAPVYNTVAEDKCAEENRNPVDTCDIGPGDLPRRQ